MKNGTIEYLDSLKKGDFCTVNIPLINNVTIPITAMYMGKDDDNRYKFIDKGNFVLPAKLIEEKAIQVNKEYDKNIAMKIRKRFKMLQQMKKRKEK